MFGREQATGKGTIAMHELRWKEKVLPRIQFFVKRALGGHREQNISHVQLFVISNSSIRRAFVSSIVSNAVPTPYPCPSHANSKPTPCSCIILSRVSYQHLFGQLHEGLPQLNAVPTQATVRHINSMATTHFIISSDSSAGDSSISNCLINLCSSCCCSSYSSLYEGGGGWEASIVTINGSS